MNNIAEPRLTDAAIAHRQDVEALKDRGTISREFEVRSRAPHPDDLFIHISGADMPDDVPMHIWLKFKAEVLGYVSNKLKDLGT